MQLTIKSEEKSFLLQKLSVIVVEVVVVVVVVVDLLVGELF